MWLPAVALTWFSALWAGLSPLPPAQAARVGLTGTAIVDAKPAPGVVVWLEGNGVSAAPAETPVLDQRNLTFSPRVLAVEMGTTVEFPNNDRVFHNVFSFRDGRRFDLGLYPVGAVKRVTFDRPGVSRIFCNIHPQMAAYVVVVSSPIHGVSNDDGSFALPEVPVGTYTYRAWRAGGTELEGTIRVQPGATLEIQWP